MSAPAPPGDASRFRPARWTMYVALAYCAVVLILMAVNSIASRSADPLDAIRLEGLRHDLTLRPNDEKLRNEVRAEDVRVRRQYLRHRDFAVRGAWLLLVGIIVFLVTSELARKDRPDVPMPNRAASERARAAAYATFRGIVSIGGLLMGTLLTLHVLARHDLVAEYAREAAHAPPKARGSAAGPASGAAAQPPPVAGLPLPGAVAGGAAGAGAAIATPVGGTLSGPGTVMAPVPVGDPGASSSAATGARPLAVKITLPTIAPSMAPGWDSQWPRFRGPTGAGIAPRAKPPAVWNGTTGKNILWKTAIPLPGWNSPIVWGDRIFFSGADAERREVYALDLESGAIVWRTPIPRTAGASDPKVQADTGYAPATVVTDGARICAIFVNGDVACLNMQGKLLWTRGFGPLENPYGHATSPIIFGSGLILQLDQGTSAEDGKSALLALDLVSGKTVWQIKRPVPSSWSTPIVVTVNGSEQLITTANPYVIAYDPHSGKELWRSECLGGEVAVSPVYADGYVLVANQGSNSAAIRPDLSGDVTKTAVAWLAGDGLPDIVSPLAANGLALLTTTDGFLTCIDIKTGKPVWDADIGKTVRASPVLAGGRVYILDVEGAMHVLEFGKQFKELARHPIGEESNATPAFAGSRVIIRAKRHVFCVGTR